MKTTPLKETELRKLARCVRCERKIGQTGLPVFYTVAIERHGLDRRAIERQQGLTMLVGGCAAIAHAMGPDEGMTVVLMDRRTVMVCDDCSLKQDLCVAALVMASAHWEKASETEEAAEPTQPPAQSPHLKR